MPPLQTGPTAWMMYLAESLNPGVMTAFPVLHPPIAEQAFVSSDDPASRNMAPSRQPLFSADLRG